MFFQLRPKMANLNFSNNRHRIKTPTVIQMEAVECGPTALKIILGYYGKFIPIEELRIECGVSRDGSKASNIVKAARRYGLQAKGYRKEPNDLREMTLPLIAFWNFNHYLVIEGFNNNTIYLNDPATGPRTISTEEFDISFTGVVLAFAPAEDFQPDGEKVTMFSLLRDWLRFSEWSLVLICVISVLTVIPGIILPNFSRVFVDRILLDTPNILPVILVSMFLTIIAYTGLFWIQKRYLLRLQTKLSISRASDFLWRIFRLPVDFFIQRYPADISARIGLTDRVARLLTEQLAVTAINLVLVTFYAVVMFTYSALLTMAVIATALINFIVLRYISRKRTDINRRLQQEQGKLIGITVNGLASIETIKSTGAEQEFFQRWAGHHAKTANSFQKLGQASLLLVVVPSFLSSMSTILLVGLGSLLVINNQLTVGSLIAYQGLMLSFLLPINQFVSLGGLVQELDADLTRINDVMRYPMDMKYASPTVEVDDEQSARLSGRIELKNVTFGYNRLSAPLISNVSLIIEPGQRIALVGKSGSGKSTIAKLIAGIYNVWEGEILIDQRNRTNIAPEVIHNSLSMVDQDIMLLNGTIRDNITLWDSTIEEEDIIQATKDAQIHRDIVRRGGYNSMIDEGGRDLSGGQRQRLEIARALAINPSILIFDEATSALDPATEKLIDESTRRRGATTIIVAHRLSTIRDCDEIIVLENGSIVQQGIHDEMINIEGVYRNLVTSEDYI